MPTRTTLPPVMEYVPVPLPEGWTEERLDAHGEQRLRTVAQGLGMRLVGQVRRTSQGDLRHLYPEGADEPVLVREVAWEADAEPDPGVVTTVAVRGEEREDGTWSAGVPDGFAIVAFTHGLDVPEQEMTFTAYDTSGKRLGDLSVIHVQSMDLDGECRHEFETIVMPGTARIVVSHVPPQDGEQA